MESSNDLYSDIFKLIRTESEAIKCSEKNAELSEGLYKISEQSIEQQFYTIFDQQLADAIIQNMKRQGILTADPAAIRAFLTGLDRLMHNAKIVGVTLCIQPDDELVSWISDFIRESLSSPYTLIDIRIDPFMLGGIELILDGRYHDYSLKKQIDEWFAKQKARKVSEIPNASNTISLRS